ncbi:TetR/AcrR family transcriptional regulator [Bradyrhizobium sp. ORS 111]|uniref:acrylate utilization transcriptional regulator AcuR n=1 Tax=Bradyrhizobium sp. ORS 111 TaxID=1685958 RepID=UPI00388D7946
MRAGVALLSEKGFSATGLEQILQQVGVPKGSFYHYFTSKNEFGLAIIDAYADYFAKRLDRAFVHTNLSPLSRIKFFMDDARAGMARFDFRRGCVVGNLGQEMGSLPNIFQEQLHGVLLDWQRRTALVFAEAQSVGELDARHNCESLAAFFWIGWEGVVLRAKLERSPDPIDIFSETFMALLTR